MERTEKGAGKTVALATLSARALSPVLLFGLLQIAGFELSYLRSTSGNKGY